jgi:outer membrane protein assembly factor BamE (lipoprotein component of BamABCDE complex)
MRKFFPVLFALGALILMSACTTNPQDHLEEVRRKSSNNLTVGQVQRTIRLGMRNAEVVEMLGSPNIVSTDEQKREVWVYDKIATECVHSEGAVGGGIGALILGHAGGGLLGFNGEKRGGARSTTQRTLTVIIKFNKECAVRDIAYHSSQF